MSFETTQCVIVRNQIDQELAVRHGLGNTFGQFRQFVRFADGIIDLIHQRHFEHGGAQMAGTLLQRADQTLLQFRHGVPGGGHQLASQIIPRRVHAPRQGTRDIAKQIKRVRGGSHGRDGHFASRQLKEIACGQLPNGLDDGCGIVTWFALGFLKSKKPTKMRPSILSRCRANATCKAKITHHSHRHNIGNGKQDFGMKATQFTSKKHLRQNFIRRQ